MADFAGNAIEDVEQAVEKRHCILREEKSFLTDHPALAAHAQDRDLIVEVAGAAIPSIMGFAASRERGMEADNAGGLSLLQPCDQRIALPNAQPAEID
jgi:hypothetical protein